MSERCVFACDIGGSKLLCGFVDEEGGVIDSERHSLGAATDPSTLEAEIERLYGVLCERQPSHRPVACGMTIPGLADVQRGVWEYACFSGIADYPIVARMEGRLGLPIRIENDVNACALAERRYGRCRDCEDFLWVTVSNGVGGGLVLGGEIWRGAFGGAGEIGHVAVESDGDVCPCGHVGCLEAVAAGPAIARHYLALTGRELTAAQIAALARRGDTVATRVLNRAGEAIGRGLGKAASLLNLPRYILGGGVMQSFDLLEAGIRRGFAAEAFARPNREVEILPTALRYEAGLLGAATVAWRDISAE